jgi:hypothetical protein
MHSFVRTSALIAGLTAAIVPTTALAGTALTKDFTMEAVGDDVPSAL